MLALRPSSEQVLWGASGTWYASARVAVWCICVMSPAWTGSAAAELLCLGRGTHAHRLPQRPAQEAIDRHAPLLARDGPQGHVDGRERVRHEGAAAHVSVRAIDFLPEMLDARRVFTNQQ